jgi:hypothetical protein
MLTDALVADAATIRVLSLPSILCQALSLPSSTLPAVLLLKGPFLLSGPSLNPLLL